MVPSHLLKDLELIESQHVVDMAGEVKRRGRELSRSSTEREPSTEAKNSITSHPTDLVDNKPSAGTASPNPRKRQSAEPDYPRRRATIAVCDSCYLNKSNANHS